MSINTDTVLQSIATIAVHIFVVLLLIISVYNLAKIPWYLGWIQTPSYGLETSMPVSLIGFRSRKLTSHPSLFLAPHALMGAILMALFAIFLWQGYSECLGKLYFGLCVVFAIHAIPERNGVPNRYAEKPINEAAIVVVLVGCIIGYFFHYPRAGMVTAFVPLLCAALLEAKKPLPFCIQKALGKHPHAESEDGDTPLPRNMQGYTGCPCAKVFDIDESPYEADYTPIE